MILTLLATSALLPMQAVSLHRVFAKGEKLQYSVKSTLQSESRGGGLLTWMPEDLDILYKFTTSVTELKADGIAQVRYDRPTVTEVTGETAVSPPKSRTEKVDFKLDLTVSPINELLEIKDLNPKKPPPVAARWSNSGRAGVAPSTQDLIDTFVGEVYRLSLFQGSIDTALDFSPKLPYDDVKPGDTWKRTAGYSPQALSGKAGQLAVQRLDYIYTYDGVMESDGKKVHRVTARLALKTDLASFANQIMKTTPEKSGLKTIPLQLDASIAFDLDLATRKTLKALAKSEGGFSIVLTQSPDKPVHEERLKGHTRLSLLPG